MTVTVERRRPARADGSRPEVRVRGGRQRRVPWVALGAVLVLVGGLGVGLLIQSAAERVSVVVAARDINPGQVIEDSDLRLMDVALDGDAAVVAGSRRAELVGRTATSRIAAGSLVSEEQFAVGSGLAAGEVVVGALLGPGALPVPNLRVGDVVRLLETGGSEGGGSGEAVGLARVFLATPGAQTGTQFLSLVVDAELAQRVSDVAAGQRLRLVLLPAGEEPEG